MNRRVYKYPIPHQQTRGFSLMLPANAKFLRTNWQQNNLMAWFLVDVDAPALKREFFFYGTGHDVMPGHEYVTTFDSGPFVIHMFELKRA